MKKTNANHLSNNCFYRKDGKIVVSVFMDRRFVDKKFDIGTLTIHYNGENINFGECCYHEEDALLTAFNRACKMIEEQFDVDELTSEITTSDRYLLKKDAD